MHISVIRNVLDQVLPVRFAPALENEALPVKSHPGLWYLATWSDALVGGL